MELKLLTLIGGNIVLVLFALYIGPHEWLSYTEAEMEAHVGYYAEISLSISISLLAAYVMANYAYAKHHSKMEMLTNAFFVSSVSFTFIVSLFFFYS